MKASEIKEKVKARYGAKAEKAKCCGGGETLPVFIEKLYTKREFDALPVEAIAAAAGCGNPTALGEIRPGETVLDLGSGGGIDCFLAVRQVGPKGKVIGVDMTPRMIDLARQNATKMGVSNVEFRLGELEHLPAEDASIDVIISNCVINLCPDKDAVFKEAWRVLCPGGRMYISDMVTHGQLPDQIRNNPEMWASCIAGAEEEEVYLGRICSAGFQEIEVVELTPGRMLFDCAASLFSIKLRARKPQTVSQAKAQ